MTTILVTGATGTVGSRVVSALAGRTNVEVRAAVHDSTRAGQLPHVPNVRPVTVDLRQPETLAPAMGGADKLFLLTPLSEDQVALGRRAVDAARAAGVKHIVKLSTAGADQEHAIQNARWHREVERHVEASGVAYTFLRPGSFMNNFLGYFRPDKDGMIYLPFGEGASSYIDARDIADAAAAVLTDDDHAGKSYMLTGGEALTVGQVAGIIGQATGRTIRYVDVPESAARAAMEGMGAPRWMIDTLLELYAIMRAGYTAGVTPDVQRLTGHAPRTFAEFARDHAAAWRS